MTINPKQQLVGWSSDYHCFHSKILDYSNRPFKDVFEMNEAIRDRHNQIFDKDSIVFNLGDALLVPRIKGTHTTDPHYLDLADNFLKTFKGKIHYLPGNHEGQLDLIKKHWKVLPQLYEINVLDDEAPKGKQLIVLCHYALRTWNAAHRGSYHCYGHSHSGLVNDNHELMITYPYSLSMDVGVDTNDFYPYTYENMKDFMKSKTFRAIDHHSARMGNFTGEDLSK